MANDSGWTFEEVRERAELEFEHSGMYEACCSLFEDLTKFDAGRKVLRELGTTIWNMMIQSDDTRFWRLLEELAPKRNKTERQE